MVRRSHTRGPPAAGPGPPPGDCASPGCPGVVEVPSAMPGRDTVRHNAGCGGMEPQMNTGEKAFRTGSGRCQWENLSTGPVQCRDSPTADIGKHMGKINGGLLVPT